jgi:general secretion pathway protein K
MLVVAIAATAAAYLSLDQQIWLRQAQNQSDRIQADAVRQGAEDWAVAILDKDAKDSTYDALTENWAKPLPPLPVEGGQVAGQIFDAQAKFNLNNLDPGNPLYTASTGMFRNLLQSLSIDPNLIDAVIDWIDADSNALAYGAEDIDYLQLPVPYRAANQPFTSVDELRLVRGFTAEIVEKLRPYITVLPQASAINVNTATPEVLTAVFNWPAAVTQQIVAQRPFKTVPEFTAKLQPLLGAGTNPPAGNTFSVTSSYFEVSIATQFGRYQRSTVSLINRGAGGGASRVLWHRQVLPGLAKTTENPDTSASGNI